MEQLQHQFLGRAHAAAVESGHLFPDYAACEAALESSWGRSQLAVLANNLFGQKQPHDLPSGAASLALSTREFLQGAWVVVPALWMKFPNWIACFRERMKALERLSGSFPHYRAALDAQSGEVFVHEVSHSWSTDPNRAGKVLAIHDLYRSTFAAAGL